MDDDGLCLDPPGLGPLLLAVGVAGWLGVVAAAVYVRRLVRR